MSEKQEKKLRYNQKLEYISRFDKWLSLEPPMFRLVKWLKWRRSMPSILVE